jgi:hypothetical protein
MEVGQGPNWGCSAKEKKSSIVWLSSLNRNKKCLVVAVMFVFTQYENYSYKQVNVLQRCLFIPSILIGGKVAPTSKVCLASILSF